MTIPNVPIVNAGLLYVNGLGISKNGNQILSMATGQARDSTDINDIILSTSININGNFIGPNGVDAAVLTTNSFYAVYIIGDSTLHNPTAGLLSLNITQPSLPTGYDMYRRVGWILTDGASNILQFYQIGNGQIRNYYYDAAILAINAGNSTTFTPITLQASVPPLATQVLFRVTYTPSAAGDIAQFLPFGSTATVGIIFFGYSVLAAQNGNVLVPCELNGNNVPTILYKVASSSDALSLSTVGYVDFIS